MTLIKEDKCWSIPATFVFFGPQLVSNTKFSSDLCSNIYKIHLIKTFGNVQYMYTYQCNLSMWNMECCDLNGIFYRITRLETFP